MRLASAGICLAFGIVLAGAGLTAAPRASQASRAPALPDTIADAEFWRLVTTLSEPGGKFPPELMSNEDSAQYVIPALKQTAPKGGVYIGVGPEQNFTYVAAVQPALAFVLDIRRDNMLQHLMYKALFELSADRAEFLARLFSRPRPAGLDARSGVADLFEAFPKGAADQRLFDDNVRAVLDRLTNGHGFPLDEADRAAISRMMQSFQTAGPHNLKGFGDKNLTYVQAMTAADLQGNRHGYLASEENFRLVQDFQRRNRLVPVVGDFAGDTALRAVGREIAQRQAVVDVFYVSNVERYLYEQGARQGRFYANVAALPLGPSSTFIRSVTRDISRRLGFALPEAPGHWWSLLSPIRDDLDAVTAGRIDSYPKLFERAAPRP